ncbi:MAG: DUF1942 domain-containing protein [Mycobacterium sp.]|uniref:DUF1942 domain-containing protein n=1 Tax=Mycobacterium sp. TaxID=1785 RepID=UPI003899A3ED
MPVHKAARRTAPFPGADGPRCQPGHSRQCEKTTGKVYFDVTGDNPDSVVYNAAGQDLLTWVQPAPTPTRQGGTQCTPAPVRSQATPAPAATPTPAPAAIPARPAPAAPATTRAPAAVTPGAPLPAAAEATPGAPLPAGSQGTPLPAGSQGTPLPASTGQAPLTTTTVVPAPPPTT